MILTLSRFDPFNVAPLILDNTFLAKAIQMDAGRGLVEPCGAEQTEDFPRDPFFRDEHREGVEEVV